MKKIDCDGCINLMREFEKLLLMLSERFPDAYKYYKKRLKIVDKKERF